jgi:SET domain-containing protein
MLLVKTKIGQSNINGIGLFADQFIPKGTITWRFNPRFDILFDPREVSEMSDQQQDLIEHFAYLSNKSGKYVYSIDDTRFTNHSNNPNIDNTTVLPGDIEVCGIAKRDIQAGEELTINYKLIDSNDAKSEEKYLKS